jgi:hypothetical protein
MNSIEAIIALISLLAFLGTLISGISFFNYELNEQENNFTAINTANSCTLIIDSMFSNSAKEFLKEFECYGEGRKVVGVEKEKRKEREIITEIKKEKFLEVKLNEHYLQ